MPQKFLDWGQTPPSLENAQIKAEKRCLEQFGFGLDPPPLDNVQIEADFFWDSFPKQTTQEVCPWYVAFGI